MHPQLHAFVRQFAAVVCAALVPVVLTTFVSLPVRPEAPEAAVIAMQGTGERHLT